MKKAEPSLLTVLGVTLTAACLQFIFLKHLALLLLLLLLNVVI